MLHLGLDIGTTKVSAAILSSDGSVHHSASVNHNAAIPGENGIMEQDMEAIWNAVLLAANGLPADLLKEASTVAVSGQMHSLVLGKENGEVSRVVTWQDRRTEGSIEELRRISGCRLYPGYGGATLAFLSRNGELDGWDWAATPADEILRRLLGKKRVESIDPTLAASFGIMDGDLESWNADAVRKLGLPQGILPKIATGGKRAGKTAGAGAIPAGLEAFYPIGDNQASILGSNGNAEYDIFLTIGTGSQLSVVLSPGEERGIPAGSGIEIRPFPGKRKLAVCAPLSGGRAMELLADSMKSFAKSLGADLGGNVPEAIDSLAMQAPPDAGGLVVHPDFTGSRTGRSGLGTIGGITLGNLNLPNLAYAFCRGIVANLFDPFPKKILRSRIKIVGSGNGLGKCRAIQRAVSERVAQPLFMPKLKEEAATGAAIYAMQELAKEETE